jgi:CDP-diacylglycerol--serine O-phosphatidyltransferase
MAKLSLKQRFLDPRPESHRPRRAAYALPTLFTAGNIFLGFLAILRAVEGALLAASGQLGNNPHFEVAAKAIGVAVVLDGLVGRIARMTNTVSDFGREMDSLADVISFGLAPAVLAVAWGVQFIEPSLAPAVRGPIFNAAYFIAFLFLLCGAARLARFNIQKNPVPKNPGRPDRKYFVGLPIPAAAGFVAAVVHFYNHHESHALAPLFYTQAAAAARFPHDQHLALLQLQGHKPQ